MSEEDGNTKDADCVLIASSNAGQWCRLLAYSGLNVRLVEPADLDAFVSEPPPHLIFLDISLDESVIDTVRAAFARWSDKAPILMAMLPSRGGVVARADLDRAKSLSAADFLASESPPAVVAARAHFAIIRHKRGDDAVQLPSASRRQVSARPVTGQLSGWRERHQKIGDLHSHKDLLDCIDDILKQSESGGCGALVLFSIDRFKRIVARYGRERGDDLLITTFLRIRRILERRFGAVIQSRQNVDNMRQAPVLGRLGVDEFIVLLQGVTNKAKATEMAQAVLAEIAAPLDVLGQAVYLSTSVGIALAPNDARDADALLSAAHAAAEHANATAGNSIVFYTPHLGEREAHKMDTESHLRIAMERGELEMYYQPVAKVAGGRVVGVEALVRWHHPDLGLVSPDSFIGVAEEAGLTVQLGSWAIRSAISEMSKFDHGGPDGLQLSINVSADMLRDMDGDQLTALVLNACAESQFPPGRVTLEVTERSIIGEDGMVPIVIKELKSHGLRIALDDFGTGYSSLSYLKTLPVDVLKIDRSFIVGNQREDIALLHAIISMARTLGIQVVAEGVETEDQLKRLKDERCDLYQGYLCSRALPVAELMDLIDAKLGIVPR